jgi:hypothetical protein
LPHCARLTPVGRGLHRFSQMEFRKRSDCIRACLFQKAIVFEPVSSKINEQAKFAIRYLQIFYKLRNVRGCDTAFGGLDLQNYLIEDNEISIKVVIESYPIIKNSVFLFSLILMRFRRSSISIASL